MTLVVRGDATREEVAALLAVVQAAAATAPVAGPRRTQWGNPRRAVRAPQAPAPDGWRTSAFPG
jgi:hypothetical protein